MRDAQLVRPFRKRRQLTDDFVLQRQQLASTKSQLELSAFGSCK